MPKRFGSWSKPGGFAVAGRSKYGAKKCVIDNIKFDSMAEGRYYEFTLKPRILAKEIEDLVFHPKFQIVINEQKVCRVDLDFQYFDVKLQETLYIDVKGRDTPVSRLKRKLIKAVLGIDVIIP